MDNNTCYVWNVAASEYVKTFDPSTTKKDAYIRRFVCDSINEAKKVIREYRDNSLNKTPQAIFQCRRETPRGHNRLDGMVEFTRLRIVEIY